MHSHARADSDDLVRALEATDMVRADADEAFAGGVSLSHHDVTGLTIKRGLVAQDITISYRDEYDRRATTRVHVFAEKG